MSKNRISFEQVLSGEDVALIDGFCADRSGTGNLPAISAFLQERFGAVLIFEPDVVKGFATDSSNLPGRADALARPVSERECAVILRACHIANIPVTVSGGKSNLTGSATPQGGVVLSTIKMTTPVADVDLVARTVSTSPGVILEDLRKRVLDASERTLEFPVDPTSRAEASIGGAIACNCSGFTPGETGAFRPWLKSIRFLLPDGRLIQAERGQFVSEKGAFLLGDKTWPVPLYERPKIKNAGGPYSSPDGVIDLVDMVVGSEGIFGLVTACTLTLAPRPGSCLDIFFSLPGEAEALQLLETVLEKYKGDLSGLKAFEYFGVNCRNHMLHKELFFHGEDSVGVYIQEPLFGKDEMDAAEAWLEILGEAGLDLKEESIIILDTERLRTLFMEARHSMPAHALEVAHQRESFTIMTDTVVPPDRFREFLDYTHNLLAEKNLDYISFGHLGDCHLHFTVLPHKEQLDDAVAVYDRIVAKSTALHGVYSGEHGTGKRKRKDFLCCYGPAAVEQLQAARAAVDPQFLFNRGNVFEQGT
jgi:D-lactate dehydrogenase (cytochrome)